MNRRHLIYLAAALLGTLLLFAGSKLQPYEEVIEHGPSPEAQRNPYLAARLFLSSQGREVHHDETLAGIFGKEPGNQVLLFLAQRETMTAQQVQHLLAWTAKGGHLIFVAEQLWDEQNKASGDLLLDALNLQQYEADEDDKADTPSGETSPQLTRLYLENEEAPAYLAFDTRFHLYDAAGKAHAWANSPGATHMLQLRHGDGLITALTDSWIWQNSNIGQYDHAWLLWYLTQDRDVTLVHGSQHASLLQLLLRHFPEALATLLLILLLGAWHLAQRHGPLQQPAAPGQRQLQEHLRGSADFFYRHADQQHLLHRLQEDVRRQARRRHAAFDSLAYTEQWHLLQTLSGLPAEHVEQALRPIPGTRLSTAEFTRQVSCLQSLRNAL